MQNQSNLVEDIKSQSTRVPVSLVTVFIIFCLNLLPLFFFLHRASVLLSGIFILFLSCLLLYPYKKRWCSGYTHEFKILIRNRIDALYFIAPFFIVPVFWNISPTILFLKFDFYTKVIVSWFIFSVIWLNKYYAVANEKTEYRSIAFYFFMFASCALWLQLLWKIGAESVVYTSVSANRFNRLAQAFYYIWEHKPFSSHFLMSFQSVENYNQQIAYAGYSPPFLILIYAYAKILAFLLGVTLEITTRVVSIFYSIIFAAVYVFTLINNPNKSALNKTLVQFSIFCVFGIMLSIPSFWIQLTQDSGTDNVFPLIMYCTLFLFVYVSRQDFTSAWFKFGLLGLCLLVPIYGILMIITLMFYAFREEYKREHYSTVISVLLFACVVVMVSYLYPIIMVKLLHYKSDSSSFLFRSGLDGDVRYYKNMLQALVRPVCVSFTREWSSLIPELIFLFIAFLIGGKILLKDKVELYAVYLFLFFPYLLTLVLWPQAVSIHPYLYDYMLELPLFFVAASLVISPPVQQRLRGPFALLFILGLISLLLYNFTMIAQATKAFSP
ncbi:hypothetical protein Lste_2794 [Legionella steelei]|uniref:Uncharacterized protein n=1 Tax=Legionella steelei TaxID=947033 RepID=A0A0W0ZKT0_9GAMM|nr:hypothetical protein [Legionella steelei]KTD69636.1 hypothetical protein Lste_2794 [Legionella steelei]